LGIKEINIEQVIIDERSRDGTWCRLPYPSHPNGYPNYDNKLHCLPSAFRFEDILLPPYYIVYYTFNLRDHANYIRKRFLAKNRSCSDRQAYCVLYWQGTVRKILREAAEKLADAIEDDIVLRIPEANGANVFATMARAGLFLKANPKVLVTKVMIVGKGKMPYNSIKELPKSVRNVLPVKAQITFKDAFNQGYAKFKGDEERAFKYAWGAVKNSYKKGKSGKWIKKE